MTATASDATALRLAALCTGMGVLHFVKPVPFDHLIPPALPGSPRFWTYASGVAELGTAALLLNPSPRRLGGRAASVLFVGVFPGNLQMAWDWRHKPWPQRSIAFLRLPLQAHLVAAAEKVHKGA